MQKIKLKKKKNQRPTQTIQKPKNAQPKPKWLPETNHHPVYSNGTNRQEIKCKEIILPLMTIHAKTQKPIAKSGKQMHTPTPEVYQTTTQ